jgi:hypothetical protein
VKLTREGQERLLVSLHEAREQLLETNEFMRQQLLCKCDLDAISLQAAREKKVDLEHQIDELESTGITGRFASEYAAITIRTDERTFQQLEELARASERSRNFLANQALKEFLERRSGARESVQDATPVADWR